MTFRILLSCMHQKGYNIINQSNIRTNVTIINQTDAESREEKFIKGKSILKIDTLERGLSRSRNMAIMNSDFDIGLLSDDDEFFVNNLEKIVLRSYDKIKDADIIIFKTNQPTSLLDKVHRLNKLELLKVGSWQISFKKSVIEKNGIKFDVNLGAGTGNGASEENKFLFDCYDKKMKIFYVPITIANVAHNNSTWFFGYDAQFFYNRGASTRYFMGIVMAFLYGLYFILTKKRLYIHAISMKEALYHLIRGIKTGIIVKNV